MSDLETILGVIADIKGKRIRDCQKHDLDPDPEAYATEQVNALTNSELLDEIERSLQWEIDLEAQIRQEKGEM